MVVRCQQTHFSKFMRLPISETPSSVIAVLIIINERRARCLHNIRTSASESCRFKSSIFNFDRHGDPEKSRDKSADYYEFSQNSAVGNGNRKGNQMGDAFLIDIRFWSSAWVYAFLAGALDSRLCRSL